MGLFGKKKTDKEGELTRQQKGLSSADVHEPVLTAIHEQQPYEVTNQQTTQAVSPSGALRDVFGSPITNPDISNPGRSREERPLDTIRAFEYSATGDERFREQQESHSLGFRPRQNFSSMPHFETNPYSQQNDNIISFGDPNAVADEPQREIYYPPVPTSHAVEKKKKKGLFRKNKD